MTFHPNTVEKLRKALNGHREELTEAIHNADWRRRQITEKQEELARDEEKVSRLTANVADCERWLNFAALLDGNSDFADTFAKAVRDDQAARDEAAQTVEVEPDVRDLHKPANVGADVVICAHCMGLWPCLTISALDVAEDFTANPELAKDREDAEAKPVNPHLTYRELSGAACTACGLSFAVGEESLPAGTRSGYQLFVHRDCPESEA